MIYNTEVLKFDLCDYDDAYILVRGDIDITRREWKPNIIQKLSTIH